MRVLPQRLREPLRNLARVADALGATVGVCRLLGHAHRLSDRFPRRALLAGKGDGFSVLLVQSFLSLDALTDAFKRVFRSVGHSSNIVDEREEVKSG